MNYNPERAQLPAKLVPPTLTKAVHRERLLDQLNRAYIDYGPAVWLFAPAGYGKTTLAADYAVNLKQPLLWYRFDESDLDPAVFFAHFRLAASSMGLESAVPAFGPEYLPGLEAYVGELLRSLLPQGITQKLLVFDDCHRVAESPLLMRILAALGRIVDAPNRMLWLSRHEPPPSLAAALQPLGIVAPAQLAFDCDEASRLAELAGFDGSLARLDELFDQSRGWPAALAVELRQPLPGQAAPTNPKADLAQRVLDGLDVVVLQQLLAVAAAETVSEPLARELAADAAVSATLARLAAKHYLVSRIDTAVPCYQLHPLLREFLLAHRRTELGDAEYAAFLIHSAAVLENHGEIGQAFDLYRQAAAWSDLQRLILIHAKTELAAGRSLQLQGWLHSLPDDLPTNPWLAFWRAAAHLALDPPLAQTLFERAHADFSGDAMGRALSAAGVLSAMFFVMDDFRDAGRWLDELEELDSLVEAADDPDLDGWILGCGNILVHFPDYPELTERWARRALARLPHSPPGRQVFLTSFLLQYHVWRGENESSRAFFALLDRQITHQEPLYQINLLNWKAVTAYLGAEHTSAYQATEAAAQLAISYGLGFYLPNIYGQEAYTALSARDWPRFRAALARMEACMPENRRVDQSFMLHLRSGLSLAEQRFSQARQEAELALSICREINLPSVAALVQHGLTQILVAAGDLAEAARHLQQLQSYAVRADKPFILFMALLTEAQARLAGGDEAGAKAGLAQALVLGKRQRYLNVHPFWQPEVIGKLCTLALEHGIEADYVRWWIAQRQLKPDGIACEEWPWPVKIRTLGQFRIDGHGPEPSRRQKDNKPMQLLQLLLAINPDGVPQQVLADALWPDSDADAAQHALEVALQRLRKLLGRNETVLLQGGTLSLNREMCWLDIWVVDEVTRRLAAQPNQAEALARRLLKIWRGPFLPGLEAPLAASKRETLAAKLSQTLEKLGAELEATGLRAVAVTCYAQAVSIEPLAENLQYRLIDCLLAEDRRAEALLTYRHCRNHYASHYGIEPSARLQALATRITARTDR
jgi:LuxR family transcriptional regulator, maltose regulon positive regulatory protein